MNKDRYEMKALVTNRRRTADVRIQTALESTGDLAAVVDELCDQCNGKSGSTVLHRPGRASLPSRDVLISMVEELRSVLFPGYFGASEFSAESMQFHMGSTLDKVLRTLQEQVRRGLCFVCPQDAPERCPDCEKDATQITRTFLSRLPTVRKMLSKDVEAAYEGDPAATRPDEAVFCYPGILAITNYRLAHELYSLKVPLIPRIITEHAHSITGIDIHPGAEIGEKFFIDHGTGVVIGETCEIGARVRIYQGVTLGAKSLPLDENGNPVKGIARHPIVEDDVVIYSGATILGRVRIGKGSVIGGNVWLTHDIPPDSRITQATARRDQFNHGEGI
jgi:serine O-acetyltransferase